jgi:hypothetical protein
MAHPAAGAEREELEMRPVEVHVFPLLEPVRVELVGVVSARRFPAGRPRVHEQPRLRRHVVPADLDGSLSATAEAPPGVSTTSPSPPS